VVVYIRIGNLINSMTISIQLPCLHGRVVIDSWSCRCVKKREIEKRNNGESVSHIYPVRGQSHLSIL
jgi:hypothetical protein